ncbi:MAG: hypothetical protein WEB04_11540 [Dehalococcoidia bacterium]
MTRMAVLAGLVLIAVALVLTVGGNGEQEDDSGRVEIYHLRFYQAELSLVDNQSPPQQYVDQYPAVVAEVGGVPITGETLAARQVLMELNRRDATASSDKALRERQLAYIDTIDSLEAIIDDELKRQAVDRLGLLPSYEDAVAYTKNIEAQFDDASLDATARELLKGQGFPDHDWASNSKIVEGYRQGMGLAKLLHEVCPTFEPPPTPAQGLDFRSASCTGFLRQERERGDITYFVRWAD